MTDLIQRTLRRLGGQLPGRVSRPGDDRYAAATSIWPKPVGRTPLAVVHCRSRRPVGNSSRTRLSSSAVGARRRPRLVRSRLMRQDCHRPERDERRGRRPRPQCRANFGRRPRLGRRRGDRSARPRAGSGLVWRCWHGRLHLGRRLRSSDRPLRTRARQPARCGGRSRGWTRRCRQTRQ